MISCATLPISGETECGDRCGWWDTPESLIVAVADGLGHGPEAALAAEIAMACIGSSLDATLEQMIWRCDARLQSTRGVALSIAVINKQTGLTKITSVGNIRTLLLTSMKDYRFGATRGIVGGGFGQLNQEHCTIHAGEVLALFSDGLDELIDVRHAMLSTDESLDECAALLLDKLADRADDAALLLYRH